MKEKYLNKYLYCIKTDKTYGILCDSIYKVVGVSETNGKTYLLIKTNNHYDMSFKVGSKYFLSPKKSLHKIRELKYNRLNKNTES